ncbi:MAG TPA: hypothetical protein PLJ60_10765 [Chryseolinea sp.]|nr:hypothetical protein [Chryseolinea sp.]
MRITLIIIISLVVASAQAQFLKRKKKTVPASEQASDQPNSLNPSATQKQYGPKKSKKGKLAKPTYGSEEAYFKRMEELQKTKRKNEKMMDKPQYSDPSYFGHKRPPKKRPPGKMKYCKECGLKH